LTSPLNNPQPDGFLALDWSQVLPYGYIPVIQTRVATGSEQPANAVRVFLDNRAEVVLFASNIPTFSRRFPGFRLELQTANEDLPDTLISQGIDRKTYRIYFEYAWYYTSGVRNPVMVEGSIRRVALSLQVVSSAPPVASDPNSYSQVVQRGGKATFLVQPQYRGPSDSGTLSRIDPIYDRPYFVGARIRMLPANSIRMEIKSSVGLTLQRDPAFDIIPLSSTVVGALFNLQQGADAIASSSQFGTLTYKYAYFYCNSMTRVNEPVGINSIFDLIDEGNESVRSLRGRGGQIVRRGSYLEDDTVIQDGDGSWPVFRVNGGHGLIVRLGDGYSSVLCITRKPVQFGASIEYLGKGIVDGVEAGDPRNGVPKSLIDDADPVNFSYITGRELRTHLMAGGKNIELVLTGIGSARVGLDGGHTPLLPVNNDIDPTKKYIVVYLPNFNASVDGENIVASEYSPQLYFTYQDSDGVVARRINMDIHYYQHRNNILLGATGLSMVQNRSSLYHFSPCTTVIREIDGLLERCRYPTVASLAENVDYFGDFNGPFPSLSAGVQPRSFRYRAYLSAKQIGVVSYDTYASDGESFYQACERVAAQVQIESGRPTVNNPLIPPSEVLDSFDLADSEDRVSGQPVSILLPRISRFHNRPFNGRVIEFPKGFFFADSRGIFYIDGFQQKTLLYPASAVPNQLWFTTYFANLPDFNGFNSNIDQSNSPELVDMYFDISEATNSCLPDDLKIPYERNLAVAISKADRYSSRISGSGIGVPRLDFFRVTSNTQSRVGPWPPYGEEHFPDLSLAEFDTTLTLKPPSVTPGISSVDPTTGAATFDSVRKAGFLGSIELSRHGRVILENDPRSSGQNEKFGWPYVVTQGTFSGIRASMDLYGDGGAVAVRNDDRFGMLHIEASHCQRYLSKISSNADAVNVDAARWYDPLVTKLSAPLESKAAFGVPFDVIPHSSRGMFAVANEVDAFKERPSEQPVFENSVYSIGLSPLGDVLSGLIPVRSGYAIASVDIKLKTSSDVSEPSSGIFRNLFVSICVDDRFQLTNGSLRPPERAQTMLWYKVDDWGMCVVRGPHYGSSLNIVVSSSEDMPALSGADVLVRWVAQTYVEKWFPEMSSASPFVDTFGCSGMYFTSDSDQHGLSCYWSCDWDMTWNLMTHVFQCFDGEKVSDVVSRSDHKNLCTYIMFKKDGMLLCKRVDDHTMAHDGYRLANTVPKSAFIVGAYSGLRDFAYALYAEAYRSGAFGSGEIVGSIQDSEMQTRLTTTHVVYADFNNNEEYKEESTNSRAILSNTFVSSLSGVDGEPIRLFPRISSAHGDDPRYCLGASGRFDFDVDGSYDFEVLANGMLFCMMVYEGSAYAFSSHDGGRSWRPSFSGLAYPMRPIKYSMDDADSVYDLQSETYSLGGAVSIDSISMCTDRYSDTLIILYQAEGAMYAQKIPCSYIYSGSPESVNLFSTAWLSSPDRFFMRPFYVMGELSAAAADAVERKRSFFRVSKTYDGESSLLAERFGVDFSFAPPAVVCLQDGSFRMFYLTADTVRGGFICGDNVTLDAQLV
jgi:hypothetical protein